MFQQQTCTILADAKKSLANLVGKAAEAQCFDEAARIALLAKKVGEIMGEWETTQDPACSFSSTMSIVKTQTRRNKRAYPFFAKDGDRLVKFGWSKKRKKRYEHKVPFEVVPALAMHLLQVIGENIEFKAKQVIPFKNGQKKVPDYQVYLAVAWLRQLGILIKRGRETYLLKLATDSKELGEQFAMLPSSVEVD